MTPKEKKTIILEEVIKPEFENAGYDSIGQTYYRMQEDCCIAVKLQSSQFNSSNTGYTFWFHIKAFPKQTSLETLKEWPAWSDSIHEDALLPDCGNLHPYRTAKGYQIDGYKNFVLQDMDLEDIRTRLRSDLQEYILPQLDRIKRLEDLETQKKEWLNRWNSERVLLMNYFSVAQMSSTVRDNIPHLRDAQRRFGLSAETIKKNQPLYEEIKAFSAWPKDDKWEFILSTLK